MKKEIATTEQRVIELEELLAEKQKTIDHLRESEGEYFRIFMTMQDGYLLHEPDGSIILANPAAAEILGYKTPEELAQKNIWKDIFLRETEREKILQKLQQEKILRNYQIPLKTADGRLLVAECTIRMNQDDNGNIVSVEGLFGDISNRVKAEVALRASENKFKKFADSTSDVLYRFDPNVAQYDFVSSAFEKVTGYQIDELSNDPKKFMTETIHAEDRDRVHAEVVSQLKKGTDAGPVVSEYRFICKDGREIWVSDRKDFEFTPDGRLARINGIVREITAEKMYRQKLAQSQKMLQDVLDAIPVRVFWKDRDLKYLGCNLHFAKDSGLSRPEDLIGKNDYQMSWVEQADLYRADDMHVLETDESKLDYEEPQTWQNGTSLWLRTSKIPLKDVEGNTYGVLGVYEDITKRKKDELALRESERRFRNAVIESPYPIMIHAEDGEIVMLSKSWTEITGYTTDDIPNITDWIYKAYGERLKLVKPVIEEIYGIDKRVHEGEFTLKTKEDQVMCWDFSSAPLGRLTDGRRCVISIGVDISERKRTEEELRWMERNYANAQRIAHVGSWEMDIMTGDSYWSNEFFRICGFEPGAIEPSLQNGMQIIHPDDRERAAEAVEKAVKEGADYRIEKKIVRPNGEIREVLSEGEIILDGMGNPDKLVGSFLDITERKKSERERDGLINKLQKAVDEVKTLSGLIPICSSCKKIRNDEGFWLQVEEYVQQRAEVQFSHSMCPDCGEKTYGEYLNKKIDKGTGKPDNSHSP